MTTNAIHEYGNCDGNDISVMTIITLIIITVTNRIITMITKQSRH